MNKTVFVLLVIVGFLAWHFGQGYLRRSSPDTTSRDPKMARAKEELDVLSRELTRWLGKGKPLQDQEDLAEFFRSLQPPKSRDMLDPWNRIYDYDFSRQAVTSSGPDGKQGTDDDLTRTYGRK